MRARVDLHFGADLAGVWWYLCSDTSRGWLDARERDAAEHFSTLDSINDAALAMEVDYAVVKDRLDMLETLKTELEGNEETGGFIFTLNLREEGTGQQLDGVTLSMVMGCGEAYRRCVCPHQPLKLIPWIHLCTELLAAPNGVKLHAVDPTESCGQAAIKLAEKVGTAPGCPLFWKPEFQTAARFVNIDHVRKLRQLVGVGQNAADALDKAQSLQGDKYAVLGAVKQY